MGRSKKVIDWDTARRAAQRFCRASEVAGVLGVCEKTLRVRCKEDQGTNLDEFLQSNRGVGLEGLRSKAYALAVNEGNSKLLAFLLEKEAPGYGKTVEHTVSLTQVDAKREQAIDDLTTEQKLVLKSIAAKTSEDDV